MNNTNGFHPSSLSIPDNEINDTGKRVSSIIDKTKSKNVNETRSMKGFNKKQKSIDVKKKRLEHSDSNNNNNNNSTKKVKDYSQNIPSTSSTNIPEHIINKNYCDSCGECYGEMISCNTCSARFHLICINPPLSKEDIPKDLFFCENCRIITKTEENLIEKDKQQKLTLPFLFDPKKTLHINGCKKTQQYHSTLGQIKLPTASNGQSLIQPSGEIKFRATSNTKSKQLSSSSSNLKRKRIDSSSPPPLPSTSINSPNTQLESLHSLFLSCQSEEFHGPSFLSDNHTQKYCFICRKSSIKQGPSIHCDYCSLTYHLDCLTPPMISLPLLNEKWMCPNHMTPILDRYLLKKKKFSTSNRVKISHRYSQIEQNIILQDFTHIKQSKIINNHQSECINISQIPKTIEEFYSKANLEQKSISKFEINDNINEQFEENLSPNESSSAYDPLIWDILQTILNHIVNDDTYEFSSIIENDYIIKSSLKNDELNTLDTIDTLLNVLNEPEHCTINKTNDLDAVISSPVEQNQISKSFSFLIDLSQFRLSHAALIHLRSQHVIYIRKHVIWFGSSPLNDICLEDFNQSYSCQYITERHACLYYDKKRNLFELLNYSEYGTIVNDLCYGLNTINENLKKCFCLNKSLCHSTWDGPAQIEQGTVIKIGCHEFLFYRHIVR